ncbi:hypothetical protein [Dyella sedimenti]|uniref:hypothetical protein n=1 Tax=Dyella sedimenti TaxID=2919947 RepID=UPI001FA98A64|nr:hypothetical protein [Dyella sedimenti]
MIRVDRIARASLLLSLVELSGCLHSPANYPGTRASSVKATDYISAQCPDFSGTYEGVGVRIGGEPPEHEEVKMKRVRTIFFDHTFPITDEYGWRKLQSNYHVHGPHSTYEKPDYATVRQLGDRSILITIGYTDQVLGSYRSDYADPMRYICKDGRLQWGGVDSRVLRSEWGPNRSESSYVIYLNPEGDLIAEDRLSVHQTFLFVIPGGTSKSANIYRFKRLTSLEPVLPPSH